MPRLMPEHFSHCKDICLQFQISLRAPVPLPAPGTEENQAQQAEEREEKQDEPDDSVKGKEARVWTNFIIRIWFL